MSVCVYVCLPYRLARHANATQRGAVCAGMSDGIL
jgi:hypothetical protein